MMENLQALVAVIEAQSLTKASTRLCVTQSAVSRRLQQLEETLGASLFDRTQRPPAPTALGMRVYEQALPIVRAVEDLLAMTKEKTDPIGVMRLGMPQGIGDLVLPEAVERLQTAFPKLNLRLRTDWSGGLCQQVAEGSLDAALVLLSATSQPPAGMAGRCLGSIQTIIVQGARQPRFRRPVRLVHLAKEDWVLNPLGCGYRAALETAMGEREGALNVTIDTYGTDMQLRMVAAGRGLGLVPRGALAASATRYDVSIVDVTDFSLSLDVWLLHRRQPGNLRKALEAVAEVVHASLARDLSLSASAQLGSRP
jgi:DNA-binding transcriptional LysR family regulator